MKWITHPAAIAFGLANIYLITLTGPIISPDHDLIYHLTGSATRIIVPVIGYLLVLWLVLTGLLHAARRRGRMRAVVWTALVLALPAIFVRAVYVFSDTPIPTTASRVVKLLLLASVVAAIFFWHSALRVIDKLRPVAASILGFTGLLGLVIFAQLCWAAIVTLHLNPAPRLHHSAHSEQPDPDPATPPHRILWLVLDELSYQQIYERRFPGLSLPAFDRLAAQSTIFTQAIPTGDHTAFILPTLMTGIPSDAVHISSTGHLAALRSPTGWIAFNQHNTVFADALSHGYSTAVAGWYNPYCRILPDVLDQCFWTYREDTPANLSSNRPFQESLLRPARFLIRRFTSLFRTGGRTFVPPTAETRDLRQHTRDYTALVDAGDRFLADPSIGFLMLHIPAPHPYGFYDRHTHAFATHHTSYIDNLALADLYLAHIREELEQRGQWDSTAVVVMGDHSWRTRNIWVHSASWTPEDDAASHGGEFDPRPAVIVKLPNQQTPDRIDTPWSAVQTRALLDQLIDQKIQTPEQLKLWAAQNH